MESVEIVDVYGHVGSPGDKEPAGAGQRRPAIELPTVRVKPQLLQSFVPAVGRRFGYRPATDRRLADCFVKISGRQPQRLHEAADDFSVSLLLVLSDGCRGHNYPRSYVA
jgi:hypothetical protein